MHKYLLPVDYVLLVLQAVLALALARILYWTTLRGLRLWAWLNLALVPFWWTLAYTATAEHFGDWCIYVGLFESLLIAFSVVELSAHLLPYNRNRVWQGGAGCIAVCAVVIGIVRWHVTAPQLMYSETLITMSAACGVLFFCIMISYPKEMYRPLARAFCIFLAGQALAAQMPVLLNCSEPVCLVQYTWRAFVARRTMPVFWVLGVVYVISQINKRSSE